MSDCCHQNQRDDVRCQCLIVAVQSGGIAEHVVARKKVVRDIVNAAIGVLIRDIVSSNGSFLGFTAHKKGAAIAKVDKRLVLDGLSIIQPEELVDLVGSERHGVLFVKGTARMIVDVSLKKRNEFGTRKERVLRLYLYRQRQDVRILSPPRCSERSVSNQQTHIRGRELCCLQLHPLPDEALSKGPGLAFELPPTQHGVLQLRPRGGDGRDLPMMRGSRPDLQRGFSR